MSWLLRSILSIAIASLLFPASVFASPAAHSVASCRPSHSQACISVSGRIITDGGAPIRGAVVNFNGSETNSDATGKYSLVAPFPVSHGCGTFFIVAWAPGFSEKRYSWYQCKLNPPRATLQWHSIPLDSVYRDSACHAMVSGLMGVFAAGTQHVSISGWAGGVCPPLGYMSLLKEPNESITHMPVHVSRLRGRYRFHARLSFRGNGMYFLEIPDLSPVTLFDLPLFVGPAPTRFPEQYLLPDPLRKVDPGHFTGVRLRPAVVKLINRVRAAKAERPLASMPGLARAAQRHAYDMAASNYFYVHPHISSSGLDLSQRLRLQGVTCRSSEAQSAVFPPEYPGHLAGALVLQLQTSAGRLSKLLDGRGRRNTAIGVGIGYDSSLELLELTVDICHT